MHLSRNITLFIHHILDQWVPPFIRDSRVVMLPVFKLLFGAHARDFMDFKTRAAGMSEEQIRSHYLKTASSHFDRVTDINSRCLEKIEQSIQGDSVLDIACGKGFLASRLASKHRVTGADFYIEPSLPRQFPQVRFREANICRLPFDDQEFDTVVCAHTLEHVNNIREALTELRRVAGKRLIIIVPRQRPYNYTFDLHLHFFPYAWSLQALTGWTEDRQLELVGGDWFYQEDIRIL